MSELTQLIIEIDRIKAAKTAIAAEIVKKGVAVPDGLTIDGYAALIAEIMLEISGDTPTILNGILKGNGANVQVASAGTDYATPAKAQSVTLAVAGWSNNQLTVSVAGVTSTNNIIVTPDPASYLAWGEAVVYASAQGSGSITFTCETVPTENLTANILIMG